MYNNTSYKFRVRAKYTDETYSDYYYSQVIKTYPYPVIEKIEIVEVTSSSITLSWTSKSQYDMLKFKISVDGIDHNYNLEDKTSKTDYTIEPSE